MGSPLFAGAERRDGRSRASAPVGATNHAAPLAMDDGAHDVAIVCGATALLRNRQFHPTTPARLVRDSPGPDCHKCIYRSRIRYFAALSFLLGWADNLRSDLVGLAWHNDRYT